MLTFVRIWLPAIVTVAGLVVMVAGGFDDIALEGGAGIIGAGLSIWLMNILFRVGLDNDRDRDEEDAARAFLDEHGHWPDEPAPVRRTPPPAPAPAPVRSAEPHRPAATPRTSTAARRPRPPRRPG